MSGTVHLISEFSGHEAMGRTVAETAARLPGPHHLITTKVHDGAGVFDSVTEVGGSLETFPARKGMSEILEGISPDLIHIHGGALSPLLTVAALPRKYPKVMTIYAWPVLPPLARIRKAGLDAARNSNVLKARVLMSSLIPPAVVISALRRADVRAILSPDDSVLRRLRRAHDIPQFRLVSGGVETEIRAHRDTEQPTIVFAGRAETVRGVDTLIEAFSKVLTQVPEARLRLLLIPRPELADIERLVAESPASAAIELQTEPSKDLLSEMASAQVGSWPFKFDYTTSPPAMAVAEALSLGLPVVATDVACVRSAVEDGRGARLVPAMDSDALARALVAILTDRNEWSQLSAAAVRESQSRTWPHMAAITEQAYAAVGNRT